VIDAFKKDAGGGVKVCSAGKKLLHCSISSAVGGHLTQRKDMRIPSPCANIDSNSKLIFGVQRGSFAADRD